MFQRSAAAAEDTGIAPAVLGARIGEGDREAEALLVSRLTPAIRLFALRNVRPPDAAEEFVNEVLLHLLEALRARKVTDLAMVHSYALGMCRNLARDRARLQRRRDSLWDRFGEREEGANDGGLSSIFTRAHVEDCLSQLTQRARHVLQRAFVLGESNGEIGEALALKEGNVRVIRHRALAQMRECLDGPVSWSAA